MVNKAAGNSEAVFSSEAEVSKTVGNTEAVASDAEVSGERLERNTVKKGLVMQRSDRQWTTMR